MISDRAIQHYIVGYVLSNPSMSLYEAARSICRHLKASFVPGEVVFIKPSNLEARVLRGARGVFWLEVYEDEECYLEEVVFDRIERDLDIKLKHIIEFLDRATKVSPSGRVFKEDVFGDESCCMELFVDAQESMCSSVMSLPGQSSEHYLKENTHMYRGEKRKYENVNTLLLYMRCPKMSVGGIENMPLLMEVFSFFAVFGRCLDIDVSLEELVVALLDRKYSSKTAFEIHKGLLCIIKKELARLCTYEAYLFFSAAAEACIDTDSSEYDTISFVCNRNWRRVRMTERNWKKVLQMLFAYICSELKIYKIACFESFFDRSCKDTDVRMKVLKFLIECACATSKLRRIVNSRIRHGRRTENRYRDSSEESVLKCNSDLNYIETKCDIECVDGVNFIFVENNVFFVRLGHVFRMHRCHIKDIARMLAPKTRSHRRLVRILTAYIDMMEKRLCDII